jgi:hypothetical protein
MFSQVHKGVMLMKMAPLSVTKGMKSEVFDAHDDAPAPPRVLTAHMAWIQGSTSCPFRRTDPQLLLPRPRSYLHTSKESSKSSKLSHFTHVANMSLQPPSLAVRSQSQSRSGGSTKAVILVCTLLRVSIVSTTHNNRLADLPEAPGSGLCLWTCPR